MLKSVNGIDFMTNKPVTFKPDTDLFYAIQVIIDLKITGATVLDDNRNVVGVLSEMDCLKAILDATYNGYAVGGTVGEYMTTRVESVSEQLDIIEVAKLMIDHKRRRIPIVDDTGVFIGQFSCRSILKAVRDFKTQKSK